MGDFGELTDSPKPVMTFEVGGTWLGVRVEQIERVAMASRVWPVPLAWAEHMGLLDFGQELVPVLTLNGVQTKRRAAQEGAQSFAQGDQLVAILHVRGEPVGLAVDKAGRVYDSYRVGGRRGNAPPALLRAEAVLASTPDSRFWLVDADRLFLAELASEPAGATLGSATV